MGRMILRRDNTPTEELQKEVIKEFKGYSLKYTKVYYLDHYVDEFTGKIDRSKSAEYCTKNQMNRNLKALKNAYHVARGDVES